MFLNLQKFWLTKIEFISLVILFCKLWSNFNFGKNISGTSILPGSDFEKENFCKSWNEISKKHIDANFQIFCTRYFGEIR